MPTQPRASQDPQVYPLALGLAVQQLRERKKLSQKELAEKIGVSQPTLSRLEQGKGRADALTMRRLSDALGVTLDHLNAQIDAALIKAERAAKGTMSKSAQAVDTPWWEGAIAVAGVIGFVGLIGFALAAVLSEDERKLGAPTKAPGPDARPTHAAG